MEPTVPACPKCDGHNQKIIKLPHPLLIHWIVNPALAINELLLGQRIPKITVECRDCKLTRPERTYLYCAHCDALHDCRCWTGKQAFGNWLGFVCPACGGRIACLWNLFSLLILAITLPLWYLPVRHYRAQHLPQRPVLKTEFKPLNLRRAFWIQSLAFGFLMWVIMALIPFVAQGLEEGEWRLGRLLISAITDGISGFAFGGFMTWYLSRKGIQRTGEAATGASA
ncbi:MAG TPA: hypothetical protein VFE24_01655 [Pirellulales bacterium]|jgi:hypothetical protein|nr:hypothetical protein [Pirellulales bacterium]